MSTESITPTSLLFTAVEEPAVPPLGDGMVPEGYNHAEYCRLPDGTSAYVMVPEGSQVTTENTVCQAIARQHDEQYFDTDVAMGIAAGAIAMTLGLAISDRIRSRVNAAIIRRNQEVINKIGSRQRT